MVKASVSHAHRRSQLIEEAVDELATGKKAKRRGGGHGSGVGDEEGDGGDGDDIEDEPDAHATKGGKAWSHVKKRIREARLFGESEKEKEKEKENQSQQKLNHHDLYLCEDGQEYVDSSGWSLQKDWVMDEATGRRTKVFVNSITGKVQEDSPTGEYTKTCQLCTDARAKHEFTAGHYSCNPCSKVCSHCNVPVLLAGLAFHIQECASVHAQQDDETQDRALQREFPASYAMIQLETESGEGKELKSRRALLRQEWRREKKEMIADLYGREPDDKSDPGTGGLRVDPGHEHHFSCKPCSIMCKTCERPILMPAFHLHRLQCPYLTKRMKQKADPKKSMRTAVSVQYPEAAKMLNAFEGTEVGRVQKVRRELMRKMHSRDKAAMRELHAHAHALTAEEVGAGERGGEGEGDPLSNTAAHTDFHAKVARDLQGHCTDEQKKKNTDPCDPCRRTCDCCGEQVFVNSYRWHLVKCAQRKQAEADLVRTAAERQDKEYKSKVHAALQTYLHLAGTRTAGQEQRKEALMKYLALAKLPDGRTIEQGGHPVLRGDADHSKALAERVAEAPVRASVDDIHGLLSWHLQRDQVKKQPEKKIYWPSAESLGADKTKFESSKSVQSQSMSAREFKEIRRRQQDRQEAAHAVHVARQPCRPGVVQIVTQTVEVNVDTGQARVVQEKEDGNGNGNGNGNGQNQNQKLKIHEEDHTRIHKKRVLQVDASKREGLRKKAPAFGGDPYKHLLPWESQSEFTSVTSGARGKDKAKAGHGKAAIKGTGGKRGSGDAKSQALPPGERAHLEANMKLLEKHLVGLGRVEAKLHQRKGVPSTMDLNRRRELRAQMIDKESELEAIKQILEAQA